MIATIENGMKLEKVRTILNAAIAAVNSLNDAKTENDEDITSITTQLTKATADITALTTRVATLEKEVAALKKS